VHSASSIWPFLKVMMARHRAGLRMAAAEERDGGIAEVRVLARRMASELQARLRQMTAWERGRGQDWHPSAVRLIRRHTAWACDPRLLDGDRCGLVEVTLARGAGGRYRRRLAQEQHAAAVYRALAAKRTGEDREILLALARAEERHAAHWAAKLHPAQRPPSEPGRRSRLLGWLAQRLGSLVVLGLVQRAEAAGDYEDDTEATAAMAADERVHALVVAELAQRHRARASGWFRAAVFGANDGLVSNFSLVAGMAGAGSSSQVILLAGLAGLLAGALSMAAGEYISVRSQRELLGVVAQELDPATLAALREHEAGELALVFRTRGLSPAQAEQRAAALLDDQEDQLAGSEVGAGEMWSGRPGRPPVPASWPLPAVPSSRSCRSSSAPAVRRS